jgi:DNA-binding MarR family transcriptional regulator
LELRSAIKAKYAMIPCPNETDAARCPLCDKHCSFIKPGCRKGAAFALQQIQETQGGSMNEYAGTAKSAMTSKNLIMLFRHAIKLMARAHHSQGHAQHAQAHVLAILKERESINQRELLEMLNVRSASLSEILGKLERNSFITKKRSDQDKRNFIISVTEQGRAVTEDHKREHLQNAEAIFAPLSTDERQQLGQLLNKIIITLEKDVPELESRHDHHGHRHGHRLLCGGKCPYGNKPTAS